MYAFTAQMRLNIVNVYDLDGRNNANVNDYISWYVMA